jgi:DNA repair protein RecN (Recombination protein N)
MQSERVTEAIAEAEEALADAEIETALSKASRAAERICRLPGFDGADHPLAHAARAAAEALERALIETGEAEAAIAALESLVEHDTSALESAEARLFALRAVARKHMVDPDLLPDVLETLQERLNLVEAGEDALIRARKAESAANAAWHAAAEKLTVARKAAAAQLEKAIVKELGPLKLGRAVIRVSVTPLGDEGGAHGADRVEFDAETNPDAGFGPLRKIASGGELARVSLALKCALAEAGSAGTLIFDEADQGVGGAVAAAIGERLIRLGRTRQVFAITHSPQVAAAARSQWLVEKGRGKSGGTRLRGLDESDRQEEIARMLSGAEITEEARAAAGRLLEDV